MNNIYFIQIVRFLSKTCLILLLIDSIKCENNIYFKHNQRGRKRYTIQEKSREDHDNSTIIRDKTCVTLPPPVKYDSNRNKKNPTFKRENKYSNYKRDNKDDNVKKESIRSTVLSPVNDCRNDDCSEEKSNDVNYDSEKEEYDFSHEDNSNSNSIKSEYYEPSSNAIEQHNEMNHRYRHKAAPYNTFPKPYYEKIRSPESRRRPYTFRNPMYSASASNSFYSTDGPLPQMPFIEENDIKPVSNYNPIFFQQHGMFGKDMPYPWKHMNIPGTAVPTQQYYNPLHFSPKGNIFNNIQTASPFLNPQYMYDTSESYSSMPLKSFNSLDFLYSNDPQTSQSKVYPTIYSNAYRLGANNLILPGQHRETIAYSLPITSKKQGMINYLMPEKKVLKYKIQDHNTNHLKSLNLILKHIKKTPPQSGDQFTKMFHNAEKQRNKLMNVYYLPSKTNVLEPTYHSNNAVYDNSQMFMNAVNEPLQKFADFVTGSNSITFPNNYL